MRIFLILLFYSFFTLASFMALFYARFPGEVIANWAESYVGEESALRVDIEDASLRPLIGSTFEGVKLYLNKEDEKPFIEGKRVGLNLSPLSLLAGSKRFIYNADLLGGNGEGWLQKEGDRLEISFSLKGLKMDEFPIDYGTVKLAMKGDFSIKGDLDLNFEKMRESTGEIALDLGPFTIPEGGSTVYGFAIPATRIERIRGEGKMERGAIDVSPLNIESDTLSAQVSGKLNIARTLNRFRVNLKVKFKLKGDIGNSIALLLGDNAKGKDGYYYYIISGNIKNPRVRPDRFAAKGKVRDRTTPRRRETDDMPRKRGIRGPGEEMEERRGADPLSREERERRREERRKRREERKKRMEERRKRMEERRKGRVEGRRPMEERGGMEDRGVFVREEDEMGQDLEPPFEEGEFDMEREEFPGMEQEPGIEEDEDIGPDEIPFEPEEPLDEPLGREEPPPMNIIQQESEEGEQ